MGDRALITFTDGERISPTVYLHWHGGMVRTFLEGAQPYMRGDVDYSCARFIGYCHTQIEGILSLGVFNGPEDAEPATMEEMSHGDAGSFLVNMKTGKVTCHGGYGEAFTLDKAKFGTADIYHQSNLSKGS